MIYNLTLKQYQQACDYLVEFLTPHKQGLIESVLNQRCSKLTLCIEDLYQPHNISAVIRSFEAFGFVNLLVLESKNEFKTNSEIELGAAKWLNLKRIIIKNSADYSKLTQKLKSERHQLVTTHLNQPTAEITELDFEQPIALFIGGEKDGLSPHIKGDYNLLLEQVGFVQSFNVSVASALMLLRLRCEFLKTKTWGLNPIERLDLRLNWYLKTVPHGLKMLSREFKFNLDS